MKRYVLAWVALGLLVAGARVAAQDADVDRGPEELAITTDDIRIDQSIAGGYDLWVRKRPGISSILITESTEAPDRRPTTFAYSTSE